MTVQKIYLIAGLALMAVAAILSREMEADPLAFTAILALSLGLMQSCVTLPRRVKLVAVLVYLAGVLLFVVGSEAREIAGIVLVLLVLLAHGVGVVRFSGRAGQS